MFTKVDKSHLDKLRSIVGDEYVLTEPEFLELASSDETEDLCYPPEVVVRPRTAQEIGEIMKLANEEKIPVTPRGGGTGLSGGCLPIHGGIVIYMDRFQEIPEIDEENLFATVEAGVITETFQDEVEKVGLFYPVDPASRGTCFIGGNIAENAGGPRAVKYGVTKDWVYGLEVVLPTGEIINPGGKLLKNVSGYNLTQLFIGSEGTLGIVTKATVKLIAKPKFTAVLLAAFDDPFKACKAVPALFHAGIVPSACEFIEGDVMRMAAEHLEKNIPNSDAAAQLMIEIDGNDEARLYKEIEKAGTICDEGGAIDVILAESGLRVNEIWDVRRAAGEAVKAHSVYKEEDTVVPRAKLPDLYVGVKEICERHGVMSACYGHAGDGNLHVNLLKDTMSDEDWNNLLPDTITEIFKFCISLGGSISGEHGIGYTQKSYLPMALSEVELNLMREIKKVLDPGGILNPGKIF
ncbi:FAD-binding protein [bacterium]|nr:FAD-binding protein [bacterium]